MFALLFFIGYDVARIRGNAFFSKKTFPPIRSSDEWGGHQLIGLFIGPYLVSEYLTVRLLRHYIDFENFDPNCALPIPKTSDTRSHFLRLLPKILVWLIIVRYVSSLVLLSLCAFFVLCFVIRTVPGAYMNLERSAQGFHRLPVVTIYNTCPQLSIPFVHFYLLYNS